MVDYVNHVQYLYDLSFFFSSQRRDTRCALVTGVQTCALPICSWPVRRPSTLTRRRATKPAIIASTTISTNQPPLIALFLRLDTWSLAGRSAKVQRQSHRNRVDPHSFKPLVRVWHAC